MNFTPTGLHGSFLVDVSPFEDERGLFARVFCKKEFEAIGHDKEFVQINHSRTNQRAAIRGLHFQVPPACEIKLIRCIRGSIQDVIVDLRKGSPTCFEHFAVELSEYNMQMLYVPEGFAHGFQALSERVEMIYHHTEFYRPEYERGLRFDDPKLGIVWKLPVSVLSPRDKEHPPLDDDFEGIDTILA